MFAHMNENSNKNSNTRKWYQRKLIIIPLLLIGIFVIMGATGKKTETNSSGVASVPDGKPKEGDVIKGVGRKALEDQYNSLKDKSKLKADEYLNSIKGQEIEWIGVISDVDTSITSTPYVSIKMGIYTVRIYDKLKQYANLEKKQLVRVKGKLDSFFELVGLDVYVDPTSIEIIQ